MVFNEIAFVTFNIPLQKQGPAILNNPQNTVFNRTVSLYKIVPVSVLVSVVLNVLLYCAEETSSVTLVHRKELSLLQVSFWFVEYFDNVFT